MGSARRLDSGAARGLRLVAAAAVVAAAVGYIREREWIDAINTGLWIAIVVMFEWQVRFPAAAGRWRWAVKTSATALYAGLGALVAIWLWRGEWMEAYDALLWLAALVVIELNILRAMGRSGRRAVAEAGAARGPVFLSPAARMHGYRVEYCLPARCLVLCYGALMTAARSDH